MLVELCVICTCMRFDFQCIDDSSIEGPVITKGLFTTVNERRLTAVLFLNGPSIGCSFVIDDILKDVFLFPGSPCLVLRNLPVGTNCSEVILYYTYYIGSLL
jgi:hypothetical protein